eukprot:365843-Chlamydomonas_euryale.AAC.6
MARWLPRIATIFALPAVKYSCSAAFDARTHSLSCEQSTQSATHTVCRAQQRMRAATHARARTATQAAYILVRQGNLTAGTPEQPLLGRACITLTGLPDDAQLPRYGSKGAVPVHVTTFKINCDTYMHASVHPSFRPNRPSIPSVYPFQSIPSQPSKDAVLLHVTML